MDNFLFLSRAIAGTAYDLAFAALVGLLLCKLWLPAALPPIGQRLRRALLRASALLVATLAAQLWLTTATMVGAAGIQQVLPELQDVLTTTHAGRIAAVGMLPAAALFALALCIDRRFALRACFVPLLALLLLRAAAGHAASNGDFTLDEAVQLIHLAATAIWAGTILIAGLLLAPHLLRDAVTTTLTTLGRRVSRTATVAIAFILATGIYKGWRGVDGSLVPLAHTQWGILLTIKSGLVLLALLLGLSNRVLLHRNQRLLADEAYRFARGLRLEALLMIAILAISAFLANSPPALS